MSYTIIVPSKNHLNMVACLTAIRDAGDQSDVIIVDDSDEPMPRDIMIALAELGNDHLAFVAGKKPFCFGRNCNLGIKAVDNPKHDVILLNDDAVLETPNGFAALARAQELNPTYGVLAAAVSGCNGFTAPLPDLFTRKEMAQEFLVRPMRMVPFVCVYIPREVIESVGLLDQRFSGYAPTAPIICPQCGWSTNGMHPDGDPFPLTKSTYATFRCAQCTLPIQVPIEEVYGGEDNDYCYRVRKSGLHAAVFDGCIVNHAKLKSTFRPDGRGRSVAGARSRFYQIHGLSMEAV
jgi:GT2 family glycosyltransferase